MSDWEVTSTWGDDEELINVKKDTEVSGLEELEDRKYRKFIESTYQVIKNVDEIGLPKPNEQIKLITFRSFNQIHFIKYIADREVIEHLNIVVYSINHEASKLLNEMIDSGRILKATVLMSNLRNKAHREKEQITRNMFVDNDKIDLFFCSSHAKITSMKTSSGNYYSIEGSGNMSYNSRVENYCMDNDKGLYEFTTKWMIDIREFLKDKKELVLT